MRLDSVTAEIRPRTDWEAVDLGFAMVRRDFWRCLTLWWLAMAVPLAVATALLWRHPLVLVMLFWWFKPVGARMVLFQLSRRLFGEKPRWKSLLREIPRAWTRRFAYRLLWARCSPWQPVTLPVEELEGVRGKSYRVRSSQLVRRGEGTVIWIYFLADIAGIWLGLAILGLAVMFIPDGQGTPWREAVESWDPQSPFEIPLLITWTAAACLMVAMSLTDLFLTGAGFGVYLNNRTWLEGWDVELAFKRLAERLGKVALVLLAFCLIGEARAADDDGKAPAERIQEVKTHKDFTVRTVTERVPKSTAREGPGLPLGFLAPLVQVMGWGAVLVAAGAGVWLIWKCRHLIAIHGPVADDAPPPSARMVMGMAVSPDTLPTDIPNAAWALWQQGRHQEAMGLLYRGAISRAIEIGRVEIQESDTEGDCMRRVDAAGAAAHPAYFRSLTHAWSRLAYAGIGPADGEVQALCQQWPFGEGGRK